MMRRLAITVALATAFAGCARGHATRVVSTTSAEPPVRASVPVRSRWELTFDVPSRRVDPDDVMIEARFTSPSGRVVSVGGFASHGRFAVRFTPREVGAHSFVVSADGGHGRADVARGVLTAQPSRSARAGGFVHRDPKRPHRMVRDDGTQVFVLGENRINVYDPTWNYENVGTAEYVRRMASYGMTTIRVFFFADCRSESATSGYQIGCLERAIGRFDERTADAIDVLFDAAESNDIDVILVANALGFTPGPETWRSWNDNPYSAARGGPASTPEELFVDPRFRPNAARKLRYIADRWASSPRLLAIDLLNEPEWDGPIPERAWIPWAEDMSRAWRKTDPYEHLVTVGSVGLQANIGPGDERPWYASPENDIVQWHLYGKEFYAPHAVALEMARKVDETWGFGKPVVCGEFAYGGEDKATYDHTHDGIWSLLFSGAGALAHSAPEFQIDSDEPMTPARGAHFRVLSQLLRSFDPKAPLSPVHDARVDRGNAWSLVDEASGDRALWLLAPDQGYGSIVEGAHVSFPLPPVDDGRAWAVTWIDDTTGRPVANGTCSASASRTCSLDVPAFERHIAARVERSAAGPTPRR